MKSVLLLRVKMEQKSVYLIGLVKCFRKLLRKSSRGFQIYVIELRACMSTQTENTRQSRGTSSTFQQQRRHQSGCQTENQSPFRSLDKERCVHLGLPLTVAWEYHHQ